MHNQLFNKLVFQVVTSILFCCHGFGINAQEHYKKVFKEENCRFFIEAGNADVDLLPIIETGDSTSFRINNWTQKDFTDFLNEFYTNCSLDRDTLYNEIISLYSNNTTIEVEITEIFCLTGRYEKYIVFYSLNKYGILSYSKGDEK